MADHEGTYERPCFSVAFQAFIGNICRDANCSEAAILIRLLQLDKGRNLENATTALRRPEVYENNLTAKIKDLGASSLIAFKMKDGCRLTVSFRNERCMDIVLRMCCNASEGKDGRSGEDERPESSHTTYGIPLLVERD
jgi:hypothetical protein